MEDKNILKKCVIEIMKGFSANHNEPQPLHIPEHCYETLADTLIERITEETSDASEEKLPSFLYQDDGEIKVGVHGDTVVTDEWNEWLKQNR